MRTEGCFEESRKDTCYSRVYRKLPSRPARFVWREILIAKPKLALLTTLRLSDDDDTLYFTATTSCGLPRTVEATSQLIAPQST